MTLLLIALLAELDIEAVPFLVSMENTDAIDAYIPSHGAFDHIVVSATLNGRTYILDPTRGVQLGDLEHLQQGNFGKGVVVAKHGPGMIDAPVPAPDFWKDITDTYDIVSDPDAVLLTSVSKYRMGQADWMLAWYSRDGAAAVEKSFLEYFQNFFPQLEQIGELDLDVDKDAAEIAITVKYRIPDAWQEDTAHGTQYFYTQADDALQDIPTFVGATRTMPFKLPHPVRTRQTQKFLLDNTWAIDNDYELISMPAFTFSRTEDFTNDLYSVAVTYETNSNKISAEDFGDTMAAIRKARNLVGVSLTVNDNIQPSPIETWLTESEDVETTIFLWQMATIFLSLIIALALVRRENIVLAEQIYHPISMTKFLVMSSVSLGIYPIFWVYMNWRWIQKVDSEDVSPGWRTFFMALTNFSLFKKMARKPGGVGWFRYAGIPLAGIILIGAISERYYNKVPEAPDWLFLFGLACILAWLPAVAHVNKLNQGHPSSLRRNSKFGWPAFGMLALFFPVFGLIVYGYF
ncbi:hypothetical protein [Parasedimentitalea maritima]|uniref:Uncharacterized protein n=1 Tax=Parasedimentitalea maritima TaxID=2578117 RepID=A0A6A4REB5_9RHOB|nr:hypothetical protein [Zongyanglinia marina]KAE9628641.1 hypothetical protein GP644_15830 [Zongyanglinia marina]